MALIHYFGKDNVVQTLLSLETCTFADNDVTNGSLIKFDDGVLHAQDMRFVRNYVPPSHGLISMQGNATWNDKADESICSSPDKGENSTLTNDKSEKMDFCNGILVEQSRECLTVGSCLPTPTPSQTPNETPTQIPNETPPSQSPTALTDCYDSLSSIQAKIDDTEVLAMSGEETIIRVCAGSTLDGYAEWEHSPLKIKGGIFRFECGATGSLDGRCLFFGGEVQILLGPEADDVFFRGFSFAGAGSVSVLAAGDSKASVVFDSCQWKVRMKMNKLKR